MNKSDKITALYCRLSQEDAKVGDSVSIENQKEILKAYAEKHHFFNARFFIDDGWSGAKFNRPGLNEMLDEVKAGRVATVIIKDQSRLGRDVLEVGLLKRTFEENGVRYIAANDNLDSANGFDMMSIFRDVLNEWYIADVSKKIKAVKKAQAERGERVNGEAPYGYVIDPNNKHRLIPDPETMLIVQKMFALFVEGKRLCEIQDWLRDNEVPTVTELMYRRKGKGRHKRPLTDLMYTWADKSIYDILSRKEYIGHTITAKTNKVSYKSNRTLRNPEEKQHIFHDTHEPLIDIETWELAQKRIETRTRPTKADGIDLFSGILFCADCNSKMYARRPTSTHKRTYSYTCSSYRNKARQKYDCTSHYINQEILADIVLADLQRVLAYVKANEQGFINRANIYGDSESRKVLDLKLRELDTVTARMKEIDVVFSKLYSEMALGKRTEKQFNVLTSTFEDEKQALSERVTVLQREISTVTERREDVTKFVKIVGKYTEIKDLTYENLHEFVDKVLVHEFDPTTSTRKVEIRYSFVGQIDTNAEPASKKAFIKRKYQNGVCVAI
jgi:DNA invertase Pin-like site-specific DNA recombinase